MAAGDEEKPVPETEKVTKIKSRKEAKQEQIL